MPRKKTKHQFRRGNEQKYLKVAVYSPRHSAGTHIPLFFLLFFAITAGIVLMVTLFTNSLVQLISQVSIPQVVFPEIVMPKLPLPDISLPSIALPEITFPTVQLPEITFDFSPFVSMFTSIVTQLTGFLTDSIFTLREFFISLQQQLVTFVQTLLVSSGSGIASFLSFLNMVILIPFLAAVERGFFAWRQVFFLPAQYLFLLHIQFSLVISGICLWTVVTFINGLIAIWELLYAAAILLAQFVAGIVAAVVNAIGSFFGAIGKGIDQTNDAIGAYINRIVISIKPYVLYVTNSFGKTISGLQASLNTFGQTSEALMKLYAQQGK